MGKWQGYGEDPQPQGYREFEELGRNRQPVALRDLLEIAAQEHPINVNSVEPEAGILRRFSTQAMSLSAISPEAHRTLALAMNRLGARSNTRAVREHPALYRTQPRASAIITQSASC